MADDYPQIARAVWLRSLVTPPLRQDRKVMLQPLHA
jgi:hypothetical protein